MKTLYIVRHAKSSRDDISLQDWERPLNEAGIERATRISKTLKQKNILPDKIISSHAVRAYNTAILFAMNMDYPVSQIEVSKKIYEKQVPALLDLIRSFGDTFSSVMLFGHNPDFTNLYNYLSGENIAKLSTSAVARIDFDVKGWRQVEKRNGKSCFILV